MSASLEALIPELQPAAKALVDLAGRAGVQPRVTSTLRSHSQQQRLYDQFLRGETQYPVAPPGTSAHEFGYAFDMICDTQENLHDLGSVWRSWGGLWSPNDEVHFEYPGFKASTARNVAACTGWEKVVAEAADLILGLAPGISEVELVSALLSVGLPHSEILKFLSGPVEYVSCGTS
jgi:hypothetical protein